jgi:hypothetical protein
MDGDEMEDGHGGGVRYLHIYLLIVLLWQELLGFVVSSPKPEREAAIQDHDPVIAAPWDIDGQLIIGASTEKKNGENEMRQYFQKCEKVFENSFNIPVLKMPLKHALQIPNSTYLYRDSAAVSCPRPSSRPYPPYPHPGSFACPLGQT